MYMHDVRVDIMTYNVNSEKKDKLMANNCCAFNIAGSNTRFCFEDLFSVLNTFQTNYPFTFFSN